MNDQLESYSFGHPDDPRSDDRRFTSETAALDAALEHQKTHPFDSLLVVWNDDSGEILRIVLFGITYSPD